VECNRWLVNGGRLVTRKSRQNQHFTTFTIFTNKQEERGGWISALLFFAA
jgi:hypothetical protein